MTNVTAGAYADVPLFLRAAARSAGLQACRLRQVVARTRPLQYAVSVTVPGGTVSPPAGIICICTQIRKFARICRSNKPSWRLRCSGCCPTPPGCVCSGH